MCATNRFLLEIHTVQVVQSGSLVNSTSLLPLSFSRKQEEIWREKNPRLLPPLPFCLCTRVSFFPIFQTAQPVCVSFCSWLAVPQRRKSFCLSLCEGCECVWPATPDARGFGGYRHPRAPSFHLRHHLLLQQPKTTHTLSNATWLKGDSSYLSTFFPALTTTNQPQGVDLLQSDSLILSS